MKKLSHSDAKRRAEYALTRKAAGRAAVPIVRAIASVLFEEKRHQPDSDPREWSDSDMADLASEVSGRIPNPEVFDEFAKALARHEWSMAMFAQGRMQAELTRVLRQSERSGAGMDAAEHPRPVVRVDLAMTDHYERLEAMEPRASSTPTTVRPSIQTAR